MKPAILFIVLGGSLALGCGGAAESADPAAPSRANKAPVETARTVAPEGATAPDPNRDAADPVSGAGGATAVERPAPLVAQADPTNGGIHQAHQASNGKLTATADVKMVKGNKKVGEMTFVQRGKWVTMTASFRDLPAGKHGLQIRTNGSCSSRALRSSKHFNPTDSRHGPPSSAQRHVGDFGNLDVSKDGSAQFEMRTDSLTVGKGATSVVGRSVVITSRADDGRTQPDGNAGKVLACGVIHD